MWYLGFGPWGFRNGLLMDLYRGVRNQRIWVLGLLEGILQGPQGFKEDVVMLWTDKNL